MNGGTVQSQLALANDGFFTAVRAVSIDALARGVGNTLSTNADFRARLGISAGTLQRALDLLAERGALQTVSRGHLGRRIEWMKTGECWRAAGLDPVRVALTPAGSAEMDVLESTLSDQLTQAEIPHTIRHSRGGVARLNALASDGYDLTTVSSGTFEGFRALQQTAELGPSLRLDDGTYYAQERLAVLSKAGKSRPRRRRVAIDRESFDHEALTKSEFPRGSENQYIEIPFPDIPAAVLSEVVDVGVWHLMRSPVPLTLAGIQVGPLTQQEARDVSNRMSAAVVVASPRRPELRAVVASLELSLLRTLQNVALDAETRERQWLTSARR